MTDCNITDKESVYQGMKDAFIICLLLAVAATETGSVVAGGVLDLALTEKPRLARKARLNNENLAKLKLGMAKEEMLKIMGKPRSSEVYKIKEAKIELISYLTETVNFESHIAQKHLTPIALQDGKVVGWGRSYFENPGEIISPK